jgi:hypothetical protein
MHEGESADLFMDIAAIAFTNVYLMPSLRHQIRRFSQGFDLIRPAIVEHLNALDLGFMQIFRANAGNTSEIERKFRGQYGVDVSTESPRTRGNAKAMREREIEIEGKILSCEWHTKISPTADRIYFHPGVDGLKGGRLIVGIFHEHLST